MNVQSIAMPVVSRRSWEDTLTETLCVSSCLTWHTLAGHDHHDMMVMHHEHHHPPEHQHPPGHTAPAPWAAAGGALLSGALAVQSFRHGLHHLKMDSPMCKVEGAGHMAIAAKAAVMTGVYATGCCVPPGILSSVTTGLGVLGGASMAAVGLADSVKADASLAQRAAGASKALIGAGMMCADLGIGHGYAHGAMIAGLVGLEVFSRL